MSDVLAPATQGRHADQATGLVGDTGSPLNVQHGVALAALSWVIDHLDGFRPIRQTQDEEFPLAELSLVALCLYRHSGDEWKTWAEKLIAFVASAYSTPTFRERLFRGRTPFASRVLLIAALRTCGVLRGDEEVRAIQALIRQGIETINTKPPHRMLELRYVFDLGGFAHDLPTTTALCRRTLLVEPLNPIYLTDADAYCVTHILFYLSDMAAKPVADLPTSYLPRTKQLVEQLLAIYLRGGHWDLVGELLLCAHILQIAGTDLYAHAWQAFVAAQRPDGMVPGPRYDEFKLESLEVDHQGEYLFATCYHSTLVAILAGVLCQPISGARA